jgi:hypothetical protein
MLSAAFWKMAALAFFFVSFASSLPGRSTAGWQRRRHGTSSRAALANRVGLLR